MPTEKPLAAQEAAALATLLADIKVRAERHDFQTLTYLISLALDEATALAINGPR